MPLTGLQGLQAQTVYAVPEANILSRSGDVADPRHGENQAGAPPYLTAPYPTQAGEQGSYGPSGLEDPFSGSWALSEGTNDPDQSPISHAAPFPSPGWGEVRHGDAEWEIQAQGMDAHAADFGTPVMVQQTPNGQDFTGATFRQTYAESEGTAPVSGQAPGFMLSGAGGGRDRVVLGNGGNPHFSVAHIQRRDQEDGVPFNRQWLDSLQRPFIVRQVGLKNTFDGPDSPFGPSGDESSMMMQGPDQAAVMTDATAYVAPPDPNVAPAPSGDASWGW